MRRGLLVVVDLKAYPNDWLEIHIGGELLYTLSIKKEKDFEFVNC